MKDDREEPIWEIFLPDIYDIEAPQRLIRSFTDREEAIEWARRFLGADEEGRVQTVFKTEV